MQCKNANSGHPTFTDKILLRPLLAIRFAKTWLQKCDNFPTSFTDKEVNQ